MRVERIVCVRFLSLALLGVAGVFPLGCAPDPSKLDEKKSYFDGGALRTPDLLQVTLFVSVCTSLASLPPPYSLQSK